MKRKAEDSLGEGKRARSTPALEVAGKYPELYAKALATKGSGARLELFQKASDEENVYREMFAQERETAKPIQDPYLMMINPHDHMELFKCTERDEHEKSLPFVFKISPEIEKPAGASSIVSKKEFLRNFDVFTESQLRFVEWDNVMIAGGSVLACLQPVPDPYDKNNRSRREYFHNNAYKGSDVDLFVYGLDEEAANRKMSEVYEAIQEAIPVEAIAFRSQHAITIVSQYPYRHVQIVLRLYKSPAEILMGFDVDSCAVGFDGENVLMMPRTHRALTHQYNTIDMTRRSPSYEMRLAKYSQRGFSVLVPSFAPSKVDPQIFERRFDQLQGLAKLLVLEKLEAPEYRTKYKEQQRMRRLRPAAKERQTFFSNLDSTFTDEWSRERLQGAANASDYSTVFLPWGPKWTASRVRKLMYTKDMILNSKWYDPKKKIHTHPCFFGTIEEVVKDCCGQCPPVKPEDVDPDSPFVSGKMEWVTVDPGQQRIGSFHPITEGDWTEGAYIQSSLEELFRAVNADDINKLKTLIEESIEEVDLDGRDSVGRTLLHLAALAGSDKCAKFLIDRKVRVSAKMCDGRMALHIAAQYNRPKIVAMLVERGKELTVENEEKAKRKADAMDEEGDEEGDEDEEEEGGDDDDEEVDEEFCIRAILERKKEEEGGSGAPEQEEDDEVDLNAKDWDMSMSALHYAIFFGCNEILPLLLDAGAVLEPLSLEQTTITPLALCIYNSNIDTARLLLQISKDVKIDERNQQRRTPLHIAAQMADIAFVRLLCSAGANVNACDNSFNTPLNLLLERAHAYPKREDGSEKDAALADPVPPEQLAVARCLIEEFDALVALGSGHLPSTSEQQQFNMSRGYVRSDATDHAKLRSMLLQPLHQAVNLSSPSVLKLLLRHITRLPSPNLHVNWIDSNCQTALDCATARLNNIESNNNWRVQSLQAEKKVLLLQKASLSKKKSGSELLSHEVECRLDAIEGELLEAEPKLEAEAELREKHKALLNEVKALVVKAGGEEFKKMKLPARDADLKESQRNLGHNSWGFHRNDNHSPITLSYQSLRVAFPGRYFNATSYDDAMKRQYASFYDAIFSGDERTVRRLTSLEVGKQTHACSCVGVKSSLMVAASQGHRQIVAALLDAAQAQFTPLPMPKKKESDGAQSINNYDLVRLMGEVKPGEYLKADGTPMQVEYEEMDHNQAVLQLNCISGPVTLLAHTDQNRRNILHYAAILGNADIIRDVAKFCTTHKLLCADYPSDDEQGLLLTKLLEGRDNCHLTPFEMAVAKGHVSCIEALIEVGGVNAKAAEQQEEEEQYAGLDVGGKKMDWALEHRAQEAKKAARGALHVAAQYDQPDSAVFLLDKGQKLWSAYLRSIEADEEDDVASAVNFQLTSTDEKGNTPLHYAAGRDHHAVLLMMLERAEPDTIALFNNDGVAPLHVAAANGYHQCVSHLLTFRASPALVDEKRGWTALHFASMGNHERVVRMLLRYMDAAAASTLSRKFRQTAGVVASYYGSRKVLNVLLADKQKKCDITLKDVCGDTALYHAVKQQHELAVQVLLDETEDLDIYRQENGTGMTVVDCARIKLVSHLRPDVSGGIVPPSSRKILEMVSEKVGDGRIVAETADVRNVTYVMLDQAGADAEKDMADAAERRRCYWRYNQDDTEVQGQTHGGTLSVPVFRKIADV